VKLNNEELDYSERKKLIPDKQKLIYAEEGSDKEEKMVFSQRMDVEFD
jgi:hypothetical protein